jgi:hypothetical protein
VFILYVFSVCGVFILWPLLFHSEERIHYKADAAMINAVESEAFKIGVVYASFAVAIPLTLDVIVDMFAKGRLMQQIFPRLFICLTLLFTSFMHICFSLNKGNFYAAIVIKEMSTILIGPILIHQYQIFYRKRSPKLYFAYIACTSFQVGTVLRAYDVLVPALFECGKMLRFIGVLLTGYGLATNLFFTPLPRGYLSQDWQSKEWYHSAFEVLILAEIMIYVAISYQYGGPHNGFDRSGDTVVGLSCSLVIFLVLLSAVITSAYRRSCARAQQKLGGVREGFVRYVFNEA